uniref:Odorant-binding protein 17 n=1 Tax=Chouioia cunea TaxID=1570515 RepID=A0A6B9CKI8_9HYME|nr:odorant-binding protein 17 [Chouioia cunea]
MKVYIVITILLVCATQFKIIECGKKMDIDGLKDMLKPMSKSCKTKTGVSDELIAGTANGIWPRERSLMCYFKCLAVMLKAMNKQGEITLREINRQLNILVIDELVPRMKQILEQCLATATPSDDACEYAFNLIVCGYKADPTLYFLPS